ncbi:MAG: transcription-repair coupling factor, partial [Mesorhizobium sp.]
KDAVPYKPVPPDLLYLSPENLIASLGPREAIDFTPFDAPDAGAKKIFHGGSRHGRSFVEERADPTINVFDVVVKHIADERAARRRVVVAGWTEGSLDRLGQILAEHHLGNLKPVATLAEAEKLEPGQAALAVLPLES